jgi:ADP-heptose:LPS heptosyltransferase
LLKPKQLSSSIQLISGEKHTKWIGIAPFAQYETKVYPIALTKQVIQQLSEKNIKIFLFGGGKKEAEILDNLASEIPNCINVAGLFSLEEEMQLISQLDAMLSMDSGNGHIAAMLGVKVLTLWGNTHPFAGFVPFNQPITNSITPDLKQFPLLPTSVYGNKKIEGYTDCMRTILPKNVVEKLLSIL